ncbi:MAG: hypothetical protein AAGN35_14730 [Bacteroidota bacterium]
MTDPPRKLKILQAFRYSFGGNERLIHLRNAPSAALWGATGIWVLIGLLFAGLGALLGNVMQLPPGALLATPLFYHGVLFLVLLSGRLFSPQSPGSVAEIALGSALVSTVQTAPLGLAIVLSVSMVEYDLLLLFAPLLGLIGLVAGSVNFYAVAVHLLGWPSGLTRWLTPWLLVGALLLAAVLWNSLLSGLTPVWDEMLFL